MTAVVTAPQRLSVGAALAGGFLGAGLVLIVFLAGLVYLVAQLGAPFTIFALLAALAAAVPIVGFLATTLVIAAAGAALVARLAGFARLRAAFGLGVGLEMAIIGCLAMLDRLPHA